MSEAGEDDAPYDLSFQIAGLFIVLASSAVGVTLPLLLYFLGVQRSPVVECTLLTFKAIGTGVIICTGFIHMLGEAGEQLNADEKPLPDVFEYDAWNSVFAITAIFLCSVGDFVSARLLAPPSQDDTEVGAFSDLAGCGHGHGHGHAHKEVDSHGTELKGNPVTSNKEELHLCEEGNTVVLENNHKSKEIAKRNDAKNRKNLKKARVIVLEAGILVHSVLIGLDLGMLAGPTYTAFLIAITFHQFFEGFALSQVLIEAEFRDVASLIFGTLFYAITTPAGIAAGIGVRSTFDSETTASCLTMGILNSLAAGILIYMGLTNLLSMWIVNNEKLQRAHWSRPIFAFVGFAIGLAVMAIIGIWA